MVGLGNMGTAVADLIARNGHRVIGWDHQQTVVSEVTERHRNSAYLSGIELHGDLEATSDLISLMERVSILFVAIPARFIEPTLAPVSSALSAKTVVVNMAKGIDVASGLTALQLLDDLFPEQPLVMLSGPSVANEFAHGLPTVVVLAGPRRTELVRVSSLLDTAFFRTRFSDDAIGVELGGVLKNIYAIGLGMFDGKNITSVNFRAVYLTSALEEMAEVGEAMGARLETFLYLAGIGDLLATALSSHSHNRKMGELLAQGRPLAEIRKEMGVLPEGYTTLQAILNLAEKLHVPAPLAKGLWDVIHGRATADTFITSFIHDFVVDEA